MELRKRAWEALEEGETSEEVGERLGIDPSCVRKWRKRVREGGTLVAGGEKTGRKQEFDGRYEQALRDAVIRAAAARTLEALDEAIVKALRAVSITDARGWFGHCGYRVPVRLSEPGGSAHS
jgi:transposase-like protein